MELELGSFSAVEVIMNPALPQLQENSGPRQVVFKPSAEIITAYLLQSDNNILKIFVWRCSEWQYSMMAPILLY